MIIDDTFDWDHCTTRYKRPKLPLGQPYPLNDHESWEEVAEHSLTRDPLPCHVH